MKLNKLRYVSRNELLVFIFSLVMVVCLLVLERGAGIGWDYHPDSVTYATLSDSVWQSISDNNLLMLFNNGYYVLCSFLGMSIIGITIMNMIIFSYTNVMIFRIHRDASRFFSNGNSIWLLCLALLICNPYRVHLGTTMLKDSLIIMLLVYAFTNQNFVRTIMVPILALFRLASILYFSIFFKRKYIIWGGVLALLIWAILGEVITNQILYFNSSSMQLRAFDTVPNFQSFGLVGAILRAILWPIFALSGAFVFLSPAPAYMMVAIGIYFGLAYTILMIGRVRVPLAVYGVMMLFGLMVTGYTSYLRYVYPILVLTPLIIIQAAAVIERNKVIR
jgi:hypothetical protein